MSPAGMGTQKALKTVEPRGRRKGWLAARHVTGTHHGLFLLAEEGQGCRTSTSSSPALAQVTDSHLSHLVPSSPQNPAQPHEGPLGHGKVDSKPCHPAGIQVSSPGGGGMSWAAPLPCQFSRPLGQWLLLLRV